MATISNLGVGSNLDLTTLYNSLESAEQTKLTTITTQQSTYQAQLSAYGKLQSSLQSLQTATAALSKSTSWNSTSVTSKNDAFTATTTSAAAVGSFTVKVEQLAKPQVLTSAAGAIDSNSKKLGGETENGTRTISITQPDTKEPLTITLKDSETTLDGIVSAINKANGNVTASVVKAKDGDYRLMLSSKSSGTDASMTVDVSGDDTLQALIGYDSTTKTGAMTVQTTAQNAKFVVNDIAVERSSNTVSDALSGVTFTLKTAGGASETLDVTRATDTNKTAINNWVTAYNSLQSTIASVTKYVAVDKGADSQSTNNGALVGDSTVRSIQSQLRGLLTDVQSGTYGILAQVGVSQNPVIGTDGATGTLKIDSDKLTKVLTENPDAVQAYFVGDGKTTGLATKMNTTLTNMLSTDTGKSGAIQNAKDGINSTLKTLSKRYDAMETSIETTMARYKAQFTSLDTLINKLNNTASYLTQQFSTSSS
ncbi:flagellar filament capping protein FliD [Superficieibacter sp.]|uniref:flagellar filament capping protein FliD n=1 Tax=Superficieibacter sp. TaxID=2303322 RepID=UPI0028A8473B|nr:flagellar filament capping protein FliD [Superficieibacter sp.]